MPKIEDIKKNPPFIEWFELAGVNDYKTLRLENRHCVKIVAAENGTGKTTLLSALHSILTFDFAKLSTIDFIYFRLKIRNTKEFIYRKKDLFAKNYSPKPSKAALELKDMGVSDGRFRKAMMHIYQNGIESYCASPEFMHTYYNCPVGRPELVVLFREAHRLYQMSDACRELSTKISKALGNLNILYLPTFRRIETEISEIPYGKTRGRLDFGIEIDEDAEDNDQLIWFGMSDVENKLEKFKERIKSTTLSSYSRISAQSLETLLSPASKKPNYIFEISEDFSSKLNLVLARLGHAGSETEAKIYDLIYSGQINENDYEGLRSHIHQIISIYATTQAQEQLIEGFANVVNSYWALSAIERQTKPEKEFIFDKFALNVSVKNNYNNETLLLNNLSSGEKQIVAIFAKLYLQQSKNYIVLIDEPELSLAMSWQRKFLIDILESPSCHQLIAITHSPFIFDNDLDSYAESLKVEYGTVQ
ncbi:AAA family ATPase [Pseudomonas sp. IT-P291]|uniref:AAA family ATPase n=1 Tax=Pseudomonas sp. IT-P291 TaxID=3026448 RepID=UPI0039E01C11